MVIFVTRMSEPSALENCSRTSIGRCASPPRSSSPRIESIALHRRADGDGFVRADIIGDRHVGEIVDHFAHARHARHAAGEQDAIDLRPLQSELPA